MELRRISQRQIAKACGVSVQAVSLALNHKPGVSAATAQRIRAKAEALGYRPDPVLASLMHYRKNARTKPGTAVMAYVHGYNPPSWPPTGCFKEMLEGVTDRAEKLGYKVELFGIDAAMTEKRLNQILIQRGIRTVVFAPQAWEEPIDLDQFDLDAYAAVGLGPTWQQSAIKVVAPFHFQIVRLAVDQLQEQGCQNIAMALTEKVDQRDQRQYVGGFLSSARHSVRSRIFIVQDQPKESLFEWLKETAPDGIIVAGSPVCEWAREWVDSQNKPIPLAHLNASDYGSTATGVDQQAFAMGAEAAEIAHSHEQAGLRGRSSRSVEIMMPGIWRARD